MFKLLAYNATQDHCNALFLFACVLHLALLYITISQTPVAVCSLINAYSVCLVLGINAYIQRILF